MEFYQINQKSTKSSGIQILIIPIQIQIPTFYFTYFMFFFLISKYIF